METRNLDQKDSTIPLKTQLRQIEKQIEEIEYQKRNYEHETFISKLKIRNNLTPDRFQLQMDFSKWEKKFREKLYLYDLLPLKLSLYQILFFSEPKRSESLILLKEFQNEMSAVLQRNKEMEDKITEIEKNHDEMISIFNIKLNELIMQKSDILEKIVKDELNSPKFYRPTLFKSDSFASQTFVSNDLNTPDINSPSHEF